MQLTHADLEQFQIFAAEQIDAGGLHSLPELAKSWILRREREREVAAIREAVNDMQAGDIGEPADAVMKDLRSDLGLASEG